MQSTATSVEEYLQNLPEERKEVMLRLIETIDASLPKGFSQGISYGMVGWAVPKETFPAGYHCDPRLPLPFLSVASQKNFVALYHMGIYASPELLGWFTSEFPKHSKYKLDMGKSCIRFKKMDGIPFGLISELCTKMSPQDWIAVYQKNLQR